MHGPYQGNSKPGSGFFYEVRTLRKKKGSRSGSLSLKEGEVRSYYFVTIPIGLPASTFTVGAGAMVISFTKCVAPANTSMVHST